MSVRFKSNWNFEAMLFRRRENKSTWGEKHLEARERKKKSAGADLGGGCRGCAPFPEMTCGFLIQLVFYQKKKLCGLLVLK